MLATAVLLLVVTTTPGLAAAQEDGTREEVRGSPSFELAAQDNRVLPGETVDLAVSVSNAGEIYSAGPSDMEERVKTARNTRIQVLESGLPEGVQLGSGAVLMGTVPPGLAEPATFRLEFSEDMEPGSYRIPLEIGYDWTRRITRTSGGSESYHEFSTTERESVMVVVRDGARFEVTRTEVDVAPGERATAEVRLRNTGNRDAVDAVATVSSDQALSFGDGSDDTTVSLGDVAEGETVTARFPVQVDQDADSRRFSLRIQTEYQDEDGITRSGGTTRASFDAAPEASLRLTTVESSLRSGGFGTATMEVVNDGSRALHDVVLVYTSEDGVNPRDPRIGVGDLASGEARRVVLRAEVEGGLDTPRVLEFTPTYSYGDRRYEADAVSARAAVELQGPEFQVETLDPSVETGETNLVELEITSDLRENVSNLTVVANAEDPLQIEYPEAHVGQLRPNETVVVGYDVDVESDATLRSYPLHVGFRFTDDAGETWTTSPQSVGLRAVDEGAPVPLDSIGVAAVVVLLLLGLGYWTYGSDLR